MFSWFPSKDISSDNVTVFFCAKNRLTLETMLNEMSNWALWDDWVGLGERNK